MSPAVVRQSFIVLDTDLILQIQVADWYGFLSRFAVPSGVRFLMTEPVWQELEYRFEKHPSHRARSEQTKRALRKGLVHLFDAGFARREFGERGDYLFAGYLSLGEELHAMIDRGEAYTHAAALEFDMLVGSNDLSSVRTLRNARARFQQPVLRLFDFVALGFELGVISEDEIRAGVGLLLKAGEGVPPMFRTGDSGAAIRDFQAQISVEKLLRRRGWVDAE